MVLLGFCSAAIAAVPPQSEAYYRAQEARAPEFLVIKVLSADEKKLGESIRQPAHEAVPTLIETLYGFSAQVEVVEVRKSKTGLVPGSVIGIQYERKEWNAPGRQPMPRLEEGRTYPAILRKVGQRDVYEPVDEAWAWVYW